MTSKKSKGMCAFFIIALIHTAGFAQKTVLFKVKFSPNKTYATELVNDMKMEMDFLVDSAKRKEITDKGVKLPMHIDMLQEMSISTKTDALTADKRVPLTISYTKMGMTMKMEGKETKQPDQFVGMKIKGFAAADGKLVVDTIEGNVSAEVKSTIEKTITELLNSVKFPEKPMRIGDKFTQEVPIVIPAGANPMNLVIKVNYTLKEISKGQAFFDYTQNILLNFATIQANSSATGSGTGKMAYNISEQYIAASAGDTNIKLKMNTSGMDVKMDVFIKSTLKAKIL